MALLSDIRRVLRSQSRVKSMNVELRRCADQLQLIAKGLAVVCDQEYGIDLFAPPAAVKLAEEPSVSYVNDEQQALREAREQLERDLSGGASDDRSEFEQLLDEAE